MSEQRGRIERDSLGEVSVPAEAAWGAQTQRAINNFSISGQAMPAEFIRALAMVKLVAAQANAGLELLDKPMANAIAEVALEIVEGHHADQFPVDVFQTGSGTSTNMNMNEVIACLANQKLMQQAGAVTGSGSIHPNDHVNLGQSSNDVIPSSIHISAALAINRLLLPALTTLAENFADKAQQYADVVKTGRTHLMDAVPIRLDQEISAWQQQIEQAQQRIHTLLPDLQALALGGTAVGTGLNAHPAFAERCVQALTQRTGIQFTIAKSRFERISCQDTAVALSGQLKTLAVALIKISNDLRWMNSGPINGLGEITLAALQPGSSIMPGKVNPVIPEAVCMAAVQVIGNDSAITVAGQSGNFQLNVMLPLVARNLLESIQLLARSCEALAHQAIADFEVNREQLAESAGHNPVLVTALNPVVGYELAATIAKRAYRESRAVLDVAEEETDLSRAELEALLDPMKLTGP